jgi:hypothetical protein
VLQVRYLPIKDDTADEECVIDYGGRGEVPVMVHAARTTWKENCLYCVDRLHIIERYVVEVGGQACMSRSRNEVKTS